MFPSTGDLILVHAERVELIIRLKQTHRVVTLFTDRLIRHEIIVYDGTSFQHRSYYEQEYEIVSNGDVRMR